MPSARTLSMVGVITASLLAISGCTINIGAGAGAPQGMSGSESMMGPQRDLMFAEMMIPHHDQAIVMGEIALENSTNDEVRDLAQRIVDGQGTEVLIMQAWLDEAGVSSGGRGMGHSMDDHNMMMGGMATDGEMAELRTLGSPEFDLAFVTMMIEHHEGALMMVQMIVNSPTAEARELAQDIIEVQNAEIDEMKAMMERLPRA